MIINSNIPALNTYNQLNQNRSDMQDSMEKLSSGQRINKAADDAAGLAISEKMRGQIRGLDQASRNSQDAISMIQTAEGSLSESQSMLQRMRELAVQSANGTNTNSDRAELQKEVDQLAKQITQTAEDSEFNTKKLLNGDFNEQFQIGANEGQNIEMNIDDMSASSLGVSQTLTAATEDVDVSGTTMTGQNTLQDSDGNAVAVHVNDGYYKTEDLEDDGGSIAVKDGASAYVEQGSALTDGENVSKGIDISSQDSADTAITDINNAIETVSAQRSEMGAYQNRLDYTISNLDNSSENLQSAESRIRDVDMAKEMMEQTRASTLAQASQSMLAQANQQPQQVLQLLQ